MYDHNQLEVPDSFMALFLVPGRLKPTATREHVTARYELCEDLASHLEEGRQDLLPGVPLQHGVSITDACIGFAQTVPVMQALAAAVRARRSRAPR